MALAPLATVADLSDRGATTGALDVALAVASDVVRDAAGCAISEETSTVVVNAGRGNILGLPGPVRSVALVSVEGAAVSATDYETLPNGLWRHCGWSVCGRPVPVTVTYTHGLPEVPADIVDLTCQLAIAWLNHAAEGGGSTAGLESVKLDDAAESYSEESAGQVSPVYLPELTRQWLASRFGAGVAVVETL